MLDCDRVVAYLISPAAHVRIVGRSPRTVRTAHAAVRGADILRKD
jgi:hypothetical protein